MTTMLERVKEHDVIFAEFQMNSRAILDRIVTELNQGRVDGDPLFKVEYPEG